MVPTAAISGAQHKKGENALDQKWRHSLPYTVRTYKIKVVKSKGLLSRGRMKNVYMEISIEDKI